MFKLENGEKSWVCFRCERCGHLKHDDEQYELWIRSKSSLTTDKQQFGSYLRTAPYQTGGRRVILVPKYSGQVTIEKFSSKEGSPSVVAVVGKLDTVTEGNEERINVVINSKGLVTVETRKERATKGIKSHNIKILNFSLPKKLGLILIENYILSTLVEIDDDINFGSISRHPITADLTTAHLWCDGHSTSISTCTVWGARARVQVSKRELHTHIHLD